MVLSKKEKENLIKEYQLEEGDTGSPQVQIALMTARLGYLQEHFKTHKKDNHSRRGVIALVGKRRKKLDFIKAIDVHRYRELIKRLGIRK